MANEEVLVNKVAESGLVVLDMETFFPEPAGIPSFDLAEHLFRGLVLKEKEFRQSLNELDWEQYRNKIVAVYCSADAIIPQWAYMLIGSNMFDSGAAPHYGTPEEVSVKLGLQAIAGMDVAIYAQQRIVLKGCGTRPIPDEAFLLATQKLRPVVKSLMFGEPCSTVPVYKRK